MKQKFFNDKYEEIELLGHGTFGKVYKVKDKDNNIFAIKQIEIPGNDEIISSLKQEGYTNKEITNELEKVAKQIEQEVKIMDKLKNSKNIVKFFEYESYEINTPKREISKKIIINIRMELLKSLDKVLETDKFTNKDAIKLGKDIANALIECENNNIIHRDVKIDNIFIDNSGNYKLGDFGEAKNVEKTLSNMTRRGTENYMAPELYKGEDGNKTVDIYSLGIVLYRIFNNKKQPFLDAEKEKYTSLERENALKLRITGEKIPKPKNADQLLSKIILKCIDYNPKYRYQSANELYKDLNNYIIEKEEKLFSKNIKDENEKELIKKDNINLIRVIELTSKEIKNGCTKTITIEGKKIEVEVPKNTKEKDEIILSNNILKEYGITNNNKITLIVSLISEDIKKDGNNFNLIIIIILIIIALLTIIICLPYINKKKTKNKEKIYEYNNLLCIVTDTNKQDGQIFKYNFIFDNKNMNIEKIEFIGNYPPMEDNLSNEDLEKLANDYSDYFCNDKLVDKNTCTKNIIYNNHIELIFNIIPKEYLETYQINNIKGNTLLDDLKYYYENRKPDSCEEIFTVSNKSCEEAFKTECYVGKHE